MIGINMEWHRYRIYNLKRDIFAENLFSCGRIGSYKRITLVIAEKHTQSSLLHQLIHSAIVYC